MKRMKKGILPVFVLCLFLSSLIAAVPIYNNQVDTEKLYKEISGKYEFYYEGQVLILTFLVKDGTLYGTSENDDEEVELEPVELESMSFETTDNGGQFF